MPPTTDPGPHPQAFVDPLEGVLHALDHLVKGTLRPPAGTPAGLLCELIELLERRFAREERDPAFEALLELRPGLYGELRRLRREHRQLLSWARRLEASTSLDPHPALARALREEVKALSRCIRSHEATEGALLQLAYLTDLGGED